MDKKTEKLNLTLAILELKKRKGLENKKAQIKFLKMQLSEKMKKDVEIVDRFVLAKMYPAEDKSKVYLSIFELKTFLVLKDILEKMKKL